MFYYKKALSCSFTVLNLSYLCCFYLTDNIKKKNRINMLRINKQLVLVLIKKSKQFKSTCLDVQVLPVCSCVPTPRSLYLHFSMTRLFSDSNDCGQSLKIMSAILKWR